MKGNRLLDMDFHDNYKKKKKKKIWTFTIHDSSLLNWVGRIGEGLWHRQLFQWWSCLSVDEFTEILEFDIKAYDHKTTFNLSENRGKRGHIV